MNRSEFNSQLKTQHSKLFLGDIVQQVANPVPKNSALQAVSCDRVEVVWKIGKDAKPGKVKLGGNTQRKGKNDT
ncbi:MAG: hypothetical protein MUE44_23415 [Oscillatoriaceae cyanobacterium Prado104]|nr:hypothetical protein [Oscillatoriaceae cyanobacterium Prado104]